MNNFQHFIKTLSIFQIRKNDEIVPSSLVNIMNKKEGFLLNRVIIYFRVISKNLDEISKLIDLLANGAQPNIYYYYLKSTILFEKVLSFAGFTEQLLPGLNITQSIGSLKTYHDQLSNWVCLLASENSSQYISQSGEVLNFINFVRNGLGQIETSINQKLLEYSQSSQNIENRVYSHSLAAMVTSYLTLTCNLYMLTNEETMKVKIQNIHEIIDHSSTLVFDLLGYANNESEFYNQVFSRFFQNPLQLFYVMSVAEEVLGNSQNQTLNRLFTDLCYSFVDFYTSLNSIVTDIHSKKIDGFINAIYNLILGGQPLRQILSESLDILLKVASICEQNLQPHVMSMYGFGYILVQDPNSNYNLVMSVALTTIRIITHVLPSASGAERLLNELSRQISMVMKELHSRVVADLKQLEQFLNDNRLVLNKDISGELNYLVKGAISVKGWDFENEQTTTLQQQFLDTAGSIPEVLRRLYSVSDDNIKQHIASFIERFTQPVSCFSSLIMQFYSCSSSILYKRIYNIASLLSYPLTMLSKTVYVDPAEYQRFIGNTANLTEMINLMEREFGRSPILLYFDISCISSFLMKSLNFAPDGDRFIQLCNQDFNSELFNLWKLPCQCLGVVTSPIPHTSKQILDILNIDDSDLLYSSILSLIYMANTDFMLGRNYFVRPGNHSFGALSEVTTKLYLIDRIIKDKIKVLQNLGQPSAALMTFLEELIADAKILAFNNAAPGYDGKIRNFENSFGQLMNIANSIPRPRVLLATQSFEKESLNTIARYVENLPKNQMTDYIIKIWYTWAGSAKSDTSNIPQKLDYLMWYISQSLLGNNPKVEDVINTFSDLSVSLASSAFNQKIATHVNNCHMHLIRHFNDIYASRSETSPLSAISSIVRIKKFISIQDLKPRESDQVYHDIMKVTIQTLGEIKQMGSSVSNEVFVRAITVVSEFDAFLTLFPQSTKVSNLLESLTSKSTDKIDQSLVELSQKIRMNKRQDEEVDIDIICDHIYDKAEAYRDEVNQIVNFCEEGIISNSSIIKPLGRMLVFASDCHSLTYESLVLNDLVETKHSQKLIENFALLLVDFCDLSIILQNILADRKSDEGKIKAMKKYNRSMTKMFDVMIYTVESPKKYPQIEEEFDKLVQKMYERLLMLSIKISHMLSLSTKASPSESWIKSVSSSANDVKVECDNFMSSFNVLKGKAVGKTASELCNYVEEMNRVISQFLAIDLRAEFPSKPLINSIKSIGQVLAKTVKISDSLSDKIIIEPDPVYAEKVLDEYSLPALPDAVEDPNTLINLVNESKNNLHNAIEQFSKGIEDDSATSDLLFQWLTYLQQCINDFVGKSLRMAKSTQDRKKHFLNQQTKLHAFTKSVTSLFYAMKVRFLRQGNFRNTMSEALIGLRTSSDQCISVMTEACNASVDVRPEETENVDQVTKELLETSKAIESMSSRLSQFAQQVNLEAVQEQMRLQELQNQAAIPDIKCEQGSLPAFLIASSQPIFDATYKIIIRAREITSDLLRRYKRIDNEAGMIKVAQDLSEAAELLVAVAEILVERPNEPGVEFKVIAAANIIKAAVAALVSQVLSKGGDSQGIMSKLVRIVTAHTDGVITYSTRIIDEILDREDANRKQPPKMAKAHIFQLNSEVNECQENLKRAEEARKRFRNQK